MANVYNKPIVVGGGGAELPVDNGAIYEGKYRVRYFDIDGTILKIEYVEEGGKLTPPTKTPNYDPDYLIFDEWNYDIENYVVERPTDVGAIYKTVNDITYLFCNFNLDNALSPKIAINDFISIDWGDGTIDTNNSHTYAEKGKYVIKISGNFKFGTASGAYFLGSSNLDASLSKIYIKKGITNIENNVFKYASSTLTVISMPNSIVSIGSQAITSCYTLKHITIPKNVTSIGAYAFGYCYSLTEISIPNGATTINEKMCYNCYSLKNISIPNGITNIGESMFYNCHSLTEISIPNSVVSIGITAFINCYSLKYISIPINVTSIGAGAFNTCYSTIDYLINCYSVPTVNSANTFNNFNRSAIMWVNDDIIEELKVASAWSTYASYMKPLSWYPNLTDPNA